MADKKLVEEIKSEILGKDYDLSFSFVSKSKIQELNKKYRKKNEPTDVLSFPYDKTSGEILICKEIAKKKSPDYHLISNDYLPFLLIHGMLHLKGLNHGAKMKQYELAHYSRYRHRHL